jgi:cytochrome c553
MKARTGAKGACLLWTLLAALACERSPATPRRDANAAQALAPGDQMHLAERIYRDGVLPSGEPLRALRADGTPLTGAEAACVQCHRRSGMGTVEGDRIIPPVAGRFLFQPRAGSLAQLDGRHSRGPDLAHALGRNRSRDPYTEETVARAIREGIDPAGLPLDGLMPHYAMSDADVGLLARYLRQLSQTWSPGVTADTLRFGTVVAPGVAPERRKAMLDVLEAFFRVKNKETGLERLRQRPYSESAHNTYRRWELSVWELSGPPDTWAAQLAAYYERQPVFALISGVSEGSWAPVQAFCEEQRVPCWFPTVDLPVVSQASYYTTYFSAGVLLEAEILARRLADERSPSAKRVLQIRGGDATAQGAAQALERALAESGIRSRERLLPVVDAAALREAVADVQGSDAVVLWLRGSDVAQLSDVPPPRSLSYFSATLAGGERAPVPAAWRAQARLVYPFELPDVRRSNMKRFHAWLRTRNLELVDERLQADAYLACLLMSEKVDDMLENLHRDYLLERAEGILAMHVTTGMYHRLGLGPGQRFASKGGYVSRLVDPTGDALVADGDWIVP